MRSTQASMVAAPPRQGSPVASPTRAFPAPHALCAPTCDSTTSIPPISSTSCHVALGSLPRYLATVPMAMAPVML